MTARRPFIAPRTLVLGAVLALVAGLALKTLFVASPDKCFVGQWRVAESSSFPKAGTIELRGDGSARLTEFQDTPYGAVWKTRDDLLEVTLVSRKRPDLEDGADPGLSWRLQWRIVERNPQTLRLEGPINGNWPQGRVTLTRQ